MAAKPLIFAGGRHKREGPGRSLPWHWQRILGGLLAHSGHEPRVNIAHHDHQRGARGQQCAVGNDR
jgi:hypothetical protein